MLRTDALSYCSASLGNFLTIRASKIFSQTSTRANSYFNMVVCFDFGSNKPEVLMYIFKMQLQADLRLIIRVSDYGARVVVLSSRHIAVSLWEMHPKLS